MIEKEIIDFLKVSPPFNLISPDQIEQIARNVSIEFFPRGESIIEQQGKTIKSLGIIQKGGVKILIKQDNIDENIIDYRGKGESFGFLSLISGDITWSDIVAIEDTICYMIPREIIFSLIQKQPLIKEYFLKSFFLHFSDKTYKEMHRKHRMFGEGDSDKLLYLSKVETLINRNVVTSQVNITIQQAAQIMSKNNVSSLIFTDEDNRPKGIVTLRDYRDKVLPKAMDLELPVSEIMSPATFTVETSMLAFEALLMMVSQNIHHLIVIEGEQLKGVVTNTDFMVLQGVSPISIVKSIEIQSDFAGLGQLYSSVAKIISTLINDGVSAKHITRIISNIHDRFVQKTISMTQFAKTNLPEAGICSAVFGSSGRLEETFKTVFNLAIIYNEPSSASDKEDMEKHCHKFLLGQQKIYAEYGFPVIELNPFQNGQPLYSSINEWLNFINESLQSGDKNNIKSICKFLDLRWIYGDDSILKILKKELYEMIINNKDYLTQVAEISTEQKTPVSFLDDNVVHRNGELSSFLDIGESGIHPIVNSIRIMALYHKIESDSTIGRLYTLTDKKGVFKEIENDILSAFEFLLNLRISDQLRKYEKGLELDNKIMVTALTPLERRSLKEVFRIITRLQLAVENFMIKAGAIG